MDRSLVLKRNAVLARGTRKIDLAILRDDFTGEEPPLLDSDVIDAEFVEIEAEPAPVQLVLVVPAPIPAPYITPGRAARATNAYAAQPIERRPILVIA
ncbi:hypothetical protein BH11MYX1_BH11MYX1_04170 [soil metagenome]